VAAVVRTHRFTFFESDLDRPLPPYPNDNPFLNDAWRPVEGEWVATTPDLEVIGEIRGISTASTCGTATTPCTSRPQQVPTGTHAFWAPESMLGA
jgi:hypothetical protein